MLPIVVSVLAVTGAVVGRVGDVPGETYTVQGTETCLEIARRVYGDPHRIDVLHRLNPGLGATPHSLHPGQVLRVAEDKGAPAELSFVRNRVFAFTPAQHPGHLREELNPGHRVSTERQSSAELTFVDRTRLQLGESTLVVVLPRATRPIPRAETLSLDTGRLRAFIGQLDAERERPLRVAAGDAHAVVERGEALLHVDDRRSTTVAQYRGTSRLRNARREVVVPEGYGSRADAGKPPSPPRPLPPPPTWPEPIAPLVFAEAEGTAILGGRYASEPTVRVTGWHVQLARDERYNDLVTDRYVEPEASRLEVRGVEPGLYRTRVAVLGGDRIEGRFSIEQLVQVVLPPRRVDVAQGRTVVELPAGVLCGIDEEPLTPVVGPREIDPTKPHGISCARADQPSETAVARFTIAAVPVSAPERMPAAAAVTAPKTEVAPVVAAPRVSPLPPRPSRLSQQFGVYGGPQIELAHGRVGGQIGLLADFRFRVRQGELGIGAQVGVEWQPALDGGLRAGCSDATAPSQHCLSDGRHAYGFLDCELAVVVAVPLTYRVLSVERRVSPILGLTPGLLFDLRRVRGLNQDLIESVDLLPALAALVGVEWRAHRAVTLRLDLGYRHVFLEPEVSDRTLSGLFIQAGVRIVR